MTALFCPRCQKVHEFQRPPMAERPGMVATWADVAEILGGVAIFLTLFLGLPFFVWLWLG